MIFCIVEVFNRTPIDARIDAERIWYASYGSNLSRWRLMCYLEGTSPTEAGNPHEGARDSSPPRRSLLAKTGHRVYFAGSKSRWGEGGYGFITRNPVGANCYLVLWDLSREQFEDVFMMEAGLAVGSVDVPWDEICARGESVVVAGNAYGTGVCLGAYDGMPVCTFTCEADREDVNPPSALYAKVIEDGLADHGVDREEAQNYVSRLANF
ncbi:hypothetical protein QPK87_07190 [Kamptonema cortianum]|nr:hypothetical protein [Geitlerinema splendidum]MDK3156359.1 hypothetical protein [Kamptonema cortianum]